MGEFPYEDRALLGRVVRAALAGEGERLGQGNFGIAWKIDTEHGALVVKLPTSHNIHGDPRSLNDQVSAVAQEGEALVGLRNHPIVPRGLAGTVDEIPAIVREYGVPAGQITPEEYEALGTALYEVYYAGWRVLDPLLLMRRIDGSIFVADVGLWCQIEGMRRQWVRDDLNALLMGVAQTQVWAPLDANGQRIGIACVAQLTAAGSACSDLYTQALFAEDDDANRFLTIAGDIRARRIAIQNQDRLRAGFPAYQPDGVPLVEVRPDPPISPAHPS